MRIADTDIDIDFADRESALALIAHVSASLEGQDARTRHPSGVYLQNVPLDPINHACSFTADDAARLGYFKIDFLNNSIYQGVRDETHLAALVSQEPYWELLDEPEMVKKLAHIHSHYGVVQSVRPRSIEDLAIVLALIRGPKRRLMGRPRTEIDAEIWLPEDNGYWFKRAHSLSYALSIVVQMNLICEQMLAEPEGDLLP